MSLFRSAAAVILAALIAAAPAQAGVTYQYDSAGRLTKATYSNGVVVEYKYDAAGNRTEILRSAQANQPPSAVADSASVSAGGYIDVQVRANDSDPDGGSLSVTAVGTPSSGSVSIQGGGTHVRYTAPGSAGTATFSYTVSDGQGGTAVATVTVTITSSNIPPVAENDYAFANVSTSQAIMVLSNDADANGHSLTVTSVSMSTGGLASIGSGGAYVVFDAPATPGDYYFTYTVSDGNGGTGAAVVFISVTGGEQCEQSNDGPCEDPIL